MRLFALLACGSIAGLALATPALADGDYFRKFFGSKAGIRVDTVDDTVDANPGDGDCADANGDCSLRAAVQEANAQGGKQKIHLGRRATYALTIGGAGEDAAASGDLDVTAWIDIKGNGSTVDAGGHDRAFDVLDGASLGVSSLHVRDGAPPSGESGGGYRSVGSLSLLWSSVEDSVADGPGASGGAIANLGGKLLVLGGELSGNTATRAGGGIEANAGHTFVYFAKLTRNETGPSPGNGGGFHLTGAGEVVVVGSRFFENDANEEGGGLWNSSGGDMFVTGTKVVDNVASGDGADQGGGGLFNAGGALRVVFSHVTDNVADGASGSGGGILNDGGKLAVKATEIADNTASRAGGGIEDREGSTAVKASAFLRNETGPSPGNGGGIHVTGAGEVSVEFSRFVENDANEEGGGLWNSAVGRMKVVGSSIVDNRASGPGADQGGGGLFNDGGEMHVALSEVSGNEADGTLGSGGGLLNNGGDLEVHGTHIAENTAVRAGGGIEARDGVTEVHGSEFRRNETGPSPGNGGGLHVTGAGEVEVEGSRFVENDASEEGGGLWNSGGGTMRVASSWIVGNRASGDGADQGGGGLFNAGGVLVVEHTRIKKNVADGASGSGGGILNDQGELTVIRSQLVRNASNRAGGGIEANVGTTKVERTLFRQNTTGDAPGNGGGLHLTGAGDVGIERSRIIRNAAANEGGGLWNSATGTMIVNDTRIMGNTAPDGPDVFNQGGTFLIDGVPVP